MICRLCPNGDLNSCEFETALLQQITDAIFLPTLQAERVRHNRRAMASRYSMRDLTQEFEETLTALDAHRHDEED